MYLSSQKLPLTLGIAFLGLVSVSWADYGKTPSFDFQAVATKHINIVAHPDMEGRMTLRPGITKAAKYIEGVFKKAGLKMQSGKTVYQQPYEVTFGQEATAKSFATGKDHKGKSFKLAIEKDYVPTVGSVDLQLVSGPMVWFNSSMPTGDLTGKIAVIARRVDPISPEALMVIRATKATELGAKGIIIVGPSAEGRRELPYYTSRSGLPRRLEATSISMTRKCWKRVSGIDPLKSDSVIGQEVGSIQMSVELLAKKGIATNVIGVVPGNDPKFADEYIVIGGHYDHLGYGETGSRSGTSDLHNGADDNASGTAGVLTLAEYFSKTKSNRRSIIFQAYSGEEIGLLGSAAWARQNLDVMPKVQTMINLDMIGRLRNENVVIYCVESANEFEKLLDSIKVPGVKPKYIMSSPGNSDHASFIANKVPSLFFFTDLHEEYHTEKDTLATINFDGMGRVLNYVRQTIEKIDASDTRYAFAAKGMAAQPQGGGDPSRPRRVRTGFVPDMGGGDGKEGMALNGVTPGSPAEAAGCKPGDRLLEFDGKKINNVEDLQAALSDAKPNVAVKIKVKRGDQVLELMITPLLPQ